MTRHTVRNGVATTQLDKLMDLDTILDSTDTEKEQVHKPCYITHPKEDKITQKANEMIAQGWRESFFIFDLQSVRDRVNMWRELLPDTAIYYSFKTNSDPELIKTMIAMGTNFDCASMGEIQQAIALGVKPVNILYANPCKAEHHIAYAKKVGVKIMTFDCVQEA